MQTGHNERNHLKYIVFILTFRYKACRTHVIAGAPVIHLLQITLWLVNELQETFPYLTQSYLKEMYAV